MSLATMRTSMSKTVGKMCFVSRPALQHNKTEVSLETIANVSLSGRLAEKCQCFSGESTATIAAIDRNQSVLTINIGRLCSRSVSRFLRVCHCVLAYLYSSVWLLKS